MTSSTQRRKQVLLKLEEVWLVAETQQGSSTVPGISLVATTEGLTVVGPNPATEHLIRWQSTTSFAFQRQTTLPDGRPATVLEIGRSAGRALQFLIPVERVSPSETVVLEVQLETMAAQNGGRSSVSGTSTVANVSPPASPTAPAQASPVQAASAQTAPVQAAPARTSPAAAPALAAPPTPTAPASATPTAPPLPAPTVPPSAGPPPSVPAAPVPPLPAVTPAPTPPAAYAPNAQPIPPAVPQLPGMAPAPTVITSARTTRDATDEDDKERRKTERRLSLTVVALAIVVLMALAVDVFLVLYVTGNRNANTQSPTAPTHHSMRAGPASPGA